MESRRRGKEGGESCGGGCAGLCVSRRRRKMRLKIGFILRSLLVVGSFLGLVVLWSSLSPRPDDPSPLSRMRVSDPPAPSGGGDLQLVLFARARGGSRGGGVGARRCAAAPQVVLAQRGPIGGRRAPSTRSPLPATGPPPRRPFLPCSPAPGSAGGGGAPRRDCGAEREESGGSGRPAPRLLRAGTAAVAAGGRGVGPGCGLWRVQA